MVHRPNGTFIVAALVALAPMALPAAAQRLPDSFSFLEAVRKQDGTKVMQFLNEPGQRMIDTRDAKGEGAMHIVVKRRDMTYLRFLLARGAQVNLQDGEGNSPLMLAVGASFADGVALLLQQGGAVNLANNGGETPLIRAVQMRDPAMVGTLLAAKADPDQADRLAGLSARDYAARDTRSPVIAQMLKDAPKIEKRAVTGPSF
jgi:ankyrin repeat protein